MMGVLVALRGYLRDVVSGFSYSSRTPKRHLDGVVAVVLFLVAQLLICALHDATAKLNDFPAPILAMLVVATSMILVSQVVDCVDGFYGKYLRGPTDLLNRHMSIGFTVPFTMIMKGPVASPRDIGLIVAGFLITGIANSILVYLAARGLQMVVSSTCSNRDAKTETQPALGIDIPTIIIDPFDPVPRRSSMHLDVERSQRCMSEASTLTNNPSLPDLSDSDAEGQAGHELPPPSNTKRLRKMGLSLLQTHPVFCSTLVGIPLVGLPVALTTGNDTTFDTFLLFSLWTGTLAAQSAARSAKCLHTHPKWQAFLSTALNAVLWSSLGTMAYAAAKAAVKHASVAQTLDDFNTGTTLANLIYDPPSPSNSSSYYSSSPSSVASSAPLLRARAATTPAMGAGDVAISILNAGIVSWGLKLFECRAQLLSRAGLATLAVASAAAAANMVCGPLLVHAMGLLPASRALAFAARSVTLALAGPAMDSLGGDVGLNAAMVVFNGIVFQMGMGLGAREWVGRFAARCKKVWEKSRDRRRSGSPYDGGEDAEKGDLPLPPFGQIVSGSGGGGDNTRSSSAQHKQQQRPAVVERQAPEIQGVTTPSTSNGSDLDADRDSDDDGPQTVAAGVAVGINAAAMGTAYLYEDGSRAAPYAALSMTIFGVMTVVFSSIRPLAVWLVAHVS